MDNKFGITGNGYNSQGQLIRSQQQINKLNNANNSNYFYTEQYRFYGSTGTNRIMENIKIRVGKDVFEECELNVGYH